MYRIGALSSAKMGNTLSPQSGTRVTVRDVTGAHELRACQDLQRRAWGITEDGYVLPVATMAAAQKFGGLILGAFDLTNETLLGFAFAFLGKLDDRLVLYSQLTGVHPAHQSTGVGRLLKLEQRRRAGEMGLGSVVWAFDPLQASNAAFNLGVLGATCARYELDMYGSRTDALNVGLATDRLIAEWSTTGKTGGHSDPWPDAVDLIQTDAAGRPERVLEIPSGANRVRVEIPARIADVKVSPGSSAGQEWQTALRAAFQGAFDAGFTAVGFTRADRNHPRYLLERTR
jgi:predicted GNAT superfamily acetyltransferase